MGRILVLAEKPEQGRDIARCLGCKKAGKGGGFLVGDQYVVTWAYGHLITLCDARDYDTKYKKWSADNLPIMPPRMQIKTVPDKEKQFQVVKALMNDKNIDEVIFATDAGREGELIARWIYTMAGCTKLIKRLWISSLTDAAIKGGFERLKLGSYYERIYHAALCRSYADWLTGINGTILYTLKYGVKLPVGRVQTPTLAIVAARQNEIDSFKSKEYWDIQAAYDKGFTGQWVNKATNENRIYDKAAANVIAIKVKGKAGVVSSVKEKLEKDFPPLLYDLSELQQDANRKYGYTAQETLDIAQRLYEHRKYITYPRTDSRYLSSDMQEQLPSIIDKLHVATYKKLVDYLVELGGLPLSDRIIDDTEITDHHAIIPTAVKPNIDSLSDDERDIYDLIVRRFLAVFYPCYEYTIKTVEVGCEGEKFVSRGKTVNRLGWMECYMDKTDDEDPEDSGKKTSIKEQILPDVSEGDSLLLADVRVHQNKTSPPSPYTDGTLILAMENAGRFITDKELKGFLKEAKGIGTKATRAAIIEKLLNTGYLKRKNKYLHPTDKGMNLIKVVHEELKSPEMTAQWEKALSQVEEGTMDMQVFMDCIKDFIFNVIDEIKHTENSQVEFEKEDTPVYRRQR